MEREKQIEEICEIICKTNGYIHSSDYFLVDAEAIYKAGYRKVEQGEWIGMRYDFSDDFPILEKSHYLKCNKCGHLHAICIYDPFTNKTRLVKVFDENIEIPSNCPNCGAKMKGE